MLLKELREGQRFEFVDKNTPLVSSLGNQNYPCSGAFTYKGVNVGTCPILLHDKTSFVFIAASGTYQREVYIIF